MALIGSSLSKKELSQKYEDAIVDFYAPIVNYLKENGAKTSDIGFAFAHSDCGVDKAARQIVEQHNLKGFATTPTEYTQYLRGTEIPPSEEFPNEIVRNLDFGAIFNNAKSLFLPILASTEAL